MFVGRELDPEQAASIPTSRGSFRAQRRMRPAGLEQSVTTGHSSAISYLPKVPYKRRHSPVMCHRVRLQPAWQAPVFHPALRSTLPSLPT